MKIADSFQHKDIHGYRFGSALFGRPRMFSHVYFIDGLLIDTGHSNMSQEIMATIGTLSVDQVFITHHHEDHTGNLAAVQQHFAKPTYASSGCVEMMKCPPSISFAQRLTWGNRPSNRHIVAEDRQISTSQYRFEIIPIPGHAVDMVGLFEAEQGWFFSADLWVGSRIRYFMRSESMKQQIESIRQVLTLDFDVLLCGHRPQFTGGKEKLKSKLQYLEGFYAKAAEFYHSGYSARAILSKMELNESWQIRLLSAGELSTLNMVKSVIRDEQTNRHTNEQTA